MKIGKTSLDHLQNELERQHWEKLDVVVPTDQLHFTDSALAFEAPSETGAMVLHEFDYTDHAFGQITEHAGIPAKYAKRMREDAPELLQKNVLHWFNAEPKRRLVRTMEGHTRAFLSDRYHMIDNYEVAEAAIMALNANAAGAYEVKSCEVTDRRLYINIVLPKLEGEVSLYDPVQGGLVISNSEIGLGAASIDPLVYELRCLNGMKIPKSLNAGGMRKTHVGRQLENNEDFSIYADDTKKAADHALLLKIRDTVKSLADPVRFQQTLERLKAANAGEEIKHPVKGIEVVTKTLGLTQDEGEGVLERLLSGNAGAPVNRTRWGLAQAVTNLANDVESYDRSQELMELGGKIITLPRKDWSVIAEAA